MKNLDICCPKCKSGSLSAHIPFYATGDYGVQLDESRVSIVCNFCGYEFEYERANDTYRIFRLKARDDFKKTVIIDPNNTPAMF